MSNFHYSLKDAYESADTFRTENISINYKVVGSGNEHILFLHGFALSIESWDAIISKINKSIYTCVCVDIMGFGFSEKPYSYDYSIEKQAIVIYNLLQSLNVSKTIIIGHSYGAIIALYLSFQSINKEIYLQIIKLVLIDVPAFENAKPMFINVLKNDILNFFIFKLLPSKILAKYIIKTTFYDYEQAKQQHLARYHFFLKIRNADRAMIQMAKQIIPKRMQELTNSYKKMNWPVLIIWGKNDKLIPLNFGLELNNKIPNSAIVIIPNCGHVPHEECPDEVSVEINFFLNSL